MPKWTHPHDKQMRDVAKIRTSVERIKKLVISARDKHWDILTVQDDADLQESQQALDKILSRLGGPTDGKTE